jgi:hypothetical protein
MQASAQNTTRERSIGHPWLEIAVDRPNQGKSNAGTSSSAAVGCKFFENNQLTKTAGEEVVRTSSPAAYFRGV